MEYTQFSKGKRESVNMQPVGVANTKISSSQPNIMPKNLPDHHCRDREPTHTNNKNYIVLFVVGVLSVAQRRKEAGRQMQHGDP